MEGKRKKWVDKTRKGDWRRNGGGLKNDLKVALEFSGYSANVKRMSSSLAVRAVHRGMGWERTSQQR